MKPEIAAAENDYFRFYGIGNCDTDGGQMKLQCLNIAFTIRLVMAQVVLVDAVIARETMQQLRQHLMLKEMDSQGGLKVGWD